MMHKYIQLLQLSLIFNPFGGIAAEVLEDQKLWNYAVSICDSPLKEYAKLSSFDSAQMLETCGNWCASRQNRPFGGDSWACKAFQFGFLNGGSYDGIFGKTILAGHPVCMMMYGDKITELEPRPSWYGWKGPENSIANWTFAENFEGERTPEELMELGIPEWRHIGCYAMENTNNAISKLPKRVPTPSLRSIIHQQREEEAKKLENLKTCEISTPQSTECDSA
mmetsp:Transcript_18449/g.33049  ORF Transcript_18449/g.33049 Transcript_18449/m.33049 type:complete len:223 (-) Transcript_18449:72-740(-)